MIFSYLVRMRTITIVGMVGILLWLCGCELFSTRSVEDPSGSSGVGWVLPLKPRTVLDNMQTAVGRRSSVDYLRSFASEDLGLEPFQFIADPQTSVNYKPTFDDWGIKQETAYAQALFSSANLPLYSLSEVSFVVEQETVLGDSATLNAHYDLHIEHLRDTAPRIMEGHLEFRLLRGNDGGWYIQQWSDVRLGGQKCWSELKAHF